MSPELEYVQQRNPKQHKTTIPGCDIAMGYEKDGKHFGLCVSVFPGIGEVEHLNPSPDQALMLITPADCRLVILMLAELLHAYEVGTHGQRKTKVTISDAS